MVEVRERSMRSTIHLDEADRIEFSGESLVIWSSHDRAQVHIYPDHHVARDTFAVLHRDLGVWLANTEELKS